MILIISLIFVHIALILYSIGVWKFFASKVLSGRHLFYFWTGFIADCIATAFMAVLARGIVLNPHTIIGFMALFFMFLHAGGATYLLKNKDTLHMKTYSKVSIAAWIFWILSYLTGIFIH
ncbi:TIGR03987 family protein [Candidatus Gracilibacteria bacterium]|nr:TIGR03987 family protein [Candidatus Gracilibacteria bacterium]